jgi:hypothetical protein
MMRPRDMSLGASLSNIVKCRCTVIYLWWIINAWH